MTRKEQTVQQEIRYTRNIRIVRKQCEFCGKVFEGQLVKTYCSSICKKKAAYQRHAEDRRKRRMEKYYKLKAGKR